GAVAVQHLAALGARCAEGLAKSIADAGMPGVVTGMGSLWTLHFTAREVTDYRTKASADPDLQRRFHIALLTEGIFSAPRGMFALSTVMNTDDIDDAVSRVGRALATMGG